MVYQEHCPHPSLKRLIRCYWTLAIPAAVPAAEGQPFLAEGLELSFNLADPIELVTLQPEPSIAHGSCICGPMTQPMRMRPTGRVEIFGVCFRPGGAYPFFPCSASELVDSNAAIEDLWGSRELGIVDTIRNDCHSTKERIDFLDSRLFHQADIRSQRTDSAVASAVHAIEVNKGQVKIDWLARSVGLSSRQLERRFRERVGMSPKQLCRSLRFKNIFKVLSVSPIDSWVSTALDCGYYDQSHLIRDFKHFTGSSPGAYFSQPLSLEKFFAGNF